MITHPSRLLAAVAVIRLFRVASCAQTALMRLIGKLCLHQGL